MSTIEETDVETKEDIGKEKKLIIHNDDHHSFDFVIDALMNICELDLEESVQCTYIIHHRGKCVVKEGSEDKLKPMKKTLVDRGLRASLD